MSAYLFAECSQQMCHSGTAKEMKYRSRVRLSLQITLRQRLPHCRYPSAGPKDALAAQHSEDANARPQHPDVQRFRTSRDRKKELTTADVRERDRHSAVLVSD